MASYRFHVQQISGFFVGCEFHHIPREDNEAADTLFKLGSSRQAIPIDIALQHLRKPSIKPSVESESIFIPEEDVVQTDIDANNQRNSGIAPSDLGTSQSKPVESMSVEPMSVDEPVFVVHVVPS
jgi:hypothetical protein